MHQINYNLDSHPVSFIHQFFELFWSSKSGGNTKIRRAVISEGPIVRMFNDAHYLNYIIAKIFNSRKHFLSEIIKGVNLFFNSTHSNMTLVYLYSCICPSGFFMLPLEVSELDIDSIKGAILILTCEINPSRDTNCVAAILQLNFNFYRR